MAGMVHLYCGDGKGKTTAAMGLAMRCAGWGEKVLVMQLMKRDNSGERRILEQFSQVTLWETYPDAEFSFRMNEARRQAASAWYVAEFQKMMRLVQNGTYRLVLLDEVISCISVGFLPEEMVLDFLDKRPPMTEVVITGRNPGEALLKRADYITEMVKQKHPFDVEIAARKGIEF